MLLSSILACTKTFYDTASKLEKLDHVRAQVSGFTERLPDNKEQMTINLVINMTLI